MNKLLFLSLLLMTFTARADVEVSSQSPDQVIGKELAPISFINEAGEKVPIASTKQGQPSLLVPIYTHCTSSCPITIGKLKEAIQNIEFKKFNVMLFDFDDRDTTENIKEFRNALKIPKDWQIFRASKNDTQALLDSIKFTYLTESGSFSHSSVIVVLSPEYKIIKFIQGTTYKVHVLEEAIKEAIYLGKNTIIVILVGIFFFFITSFGALFYWMKEEPKDKMSQLLLGKSH